MKYEGSDHRPLLTYLDTTRKQENKIFRYDRRLKDNMEVKQLIKETWDSVPHLHVEDKLALCRKAICKWSKRFYENSRQTLESLRNQLEEAMIDPNPDEETIYQLNNSLLQTYKKEEEF